MALTVGYALFFSPAKTGYLDRSKITLGYMLSTNN